MPLEAAAVAEAVAVAVAVVEAAVEAAGTVAALAAQTPGVEPLGRPHDAAAVPAAGAEVGLGFSLLCSRESHPQ